VSSGASWTLSSVVYAGDDGVVGNFHFMPVAYIPTTYHWLFSDRGHLFGPRFGLTPVRRWPFPISMPTSRGFLGFSEERPGLVAATTSVKAFTSATSSIGTPPVWGRESRTSTSQLLGKIWDSAPDFLKELRSAMLPSPSMDSQNPVLQMVTHIAPPALPAQMDLGIRNDVQLRGFRPYQGGEFQIGFQYIADWSNDKDDKGNPITHGGWGITVRHVQDVLGGDNKLVFQYGKGGGTGFGTLGRFYYPDFSHLLGHLPNESRLRILDVLTIQPNDWLGTQLVGVYQRDNTGTGKTDALTEWYSAGTRVSVALVEHAKLLGEVGFDRVKKHNGADPQWLAKITGALAIAGAKGFWGRPELRLFYTYAQWSKAAAIATVDSGQVYTSPDDNGAYKLSGSIAGLQAEAMW
jgi:hypothetical protein